MRSILKEKKGQLDNPIILLAFLVVGLIILAPIVLKLFTTINAGVGAGIGNVTSGGEIGRQNFSIVMETGINFWDKIIITMFIVLILTLFVSAFFIDANPFFIILYIVSCLVLILMAPTIISVADKIYESSSYSAEVASLAFMNTLRIHYAEFLVGLMVITGIIIYGKIAFMRGNGGNGRR